MPIEVGAKIQVCDQEEFHALDRLVMGFVFEVHSEFGRLLDEDLYKSEVAIRCAHNGLQPAEREVRIRVSHDGFSKDYFMDLLIGHTFMLEGKVAERLSAAHRGQALNYLLLTGMQHGRLVNFRRERVEHEFVSTTLTPEERRRFLIVEREWVAMNAASGQLKAKTVELLEDWGAFLDVNLYREALVHFLGGADSVRQEVDLFSGSRRVGGQHLNLLNPQTGFAVTMKHEDIGAMRDHLNRLL